MSGREQYVIDVMWQIEHPDSRAASLPNLIGPFTSRQEAEEWGRLNIPNGEWAIDPLAWPWMEARR